MRLFVFTLILLSSLSAHAQFGVQVSTNFNQAQNIFPAGSIAVEEDVDFSIGTEVALNYWFRLPKQRIEFLPTIYYARSGFENSDAHLAEYGAQMKVNVYPFDFLGDCDCPTFGKQGPQLQKGLFLQVSGGYALYDLNSGLGFDLANQENSQGATFGGAIGIDFGLSNLVTLTPVAGVRFGTSPYTDSGFANVSGIITDVERSNLTTFHAGLLVSFRFDHKRY
jgi:hypothetical protein